MTPLDASRYPPTTEVLREFRGGCLIMSAAGAEEFVALVHAAFDGLV